MLTSVWVQRTGVAQWLHFVPFVTCLFPLFGMLWLGEVALSQWIPVRAEMVYVNDKLGAR